MADQNGSEFWKPAGEIARQHDAQIFGYWPVGSEYGNPADMVRQDHANWREPTREDMEYTDGVIIRITDDKGQHHYWTFYPGPDDDFDLDWYVDYVYAEYGDELG